MAKGLMDDRTDANRRAWSPAQFQWYVNNAADEPQLLTDANGALRCECREWQRSSFAHQAGATDFTGNHAYCVHMEMLVRQEGDAGFLMTTTIATPCPLPLDITVYWASPRRLAGVPRYLSASVFVVVLDDELFEVYGATQEFLGYVRPTVGRAELRGMAAEDYMAYALMTPCRQCGCVAGPGDQDPVHRYMVLHRGIQLIHGKDVCPSCTNDDLIPGGT